MFIDSHAHLDAFEDIEDVLRRAQEAGISHIINICTSRASLEKGLLLSQKHPWIYCSSSTTPHDIAQEEDFAFFDKQASSLVAIGETGLDYYYTHSSKEEQTRSFVRYMHLATKHHLPLIIHCREAFQDLFSLLDQEYQGPFILHCFTGSLQEAQGVLKRGGMISFSGIVTFKKSEALRQVAKEVPLHQLLIETDAPYLAPQSQRGKRNEPAFLPEIAQAIADAKTVSLEEVANASRENALRIFVDRNR